MIIISDGKVLFEGFEVLLAVNDKGLLEVTAWVSDSGDDEDDEIDTCTPVIDVVQKATDVGRRDGFDGDVDPVVLTRAATKPLVLGHTDRGFVYSEFYDLYGQRCTLQLSSLATDDAVWLGVSTDMSGKKVNTRMHLNRKGVAALLPHLIEFVKCGDLEPTERRPSVNEDFKIRVVQKSPSHAPHKNDTKIKATHIPTGMKAVVDVSHRPQYNRALALSMLNAGLDVLTAKGGDDS